MQCLHSRFPRVVGHGRWCPLARPRRFSPRGGRFPLGCDGYPADSQRLSPQWTRGKSAATGRLGRRGGVDRQWILRDGDRESWRIENEQGVVTSHAMGELKQRAGCGSRKRRKRKRIGRGETRQIWRKFRISQEGGADGGFHQTA